MPADASGSHLREFFVATDVVDPSRRPITYDAGGRADVECHRAIARTVASSRRGAPLEGDGGPCVIRFTDVHDAVGAAIAIARSFREPEELEPRDRRVPSGHRARVAVHVGAAWHRVGLWLGPVLDHVGRLLDAASGDQIIVSDTVAALLVRDDVALHDLGSIDTCKASTAPGTCTRWTFPASPAPIPR